MLLCDVGNTSYHFLDEKKNYKEDVLSFSPQTITQKVYYICVNSHANGFLENLENWIDLAQFIDMKNYYETMGIDRILACEALENGVIVDAGSAITVDVVRDGVFEGGFIYPGTRAMSETYKSISSALEYPFNYSLDLEKLPKNSQDAISYGYLKLLYSEVTSHNMPVILTGGDAENLEMLFPDARVNKELIFDAMKKIVSKI